MFSSTQKFLLNYSWGVHQCLLSKKKENIYVGTTVDICMYVFKNSWYIILYVSGIGYSGLYTLGFDHHIKSSNHVIMQSYIYIYGIWGKVGIFK